ncbi:alcohol dehydrogenase [Terrimonas sp.]|uniref:aldo/keto reductase n=1 Tax=Terrimonas sp. TaxID=1914338 RepID=UPI000D524798|nr:aldo/keto reductase [Terrimonas sp.]PVD50601.1 alcohol dehydrogenase [Terrimonas sp.]
MTKRRLGKSDIEIASLIFGGNVFGWTVDEKQSFALLDDFTAAGFNCIDTADSYSRWVPGNSGGESERIIGKWMKARNNRDKVIIATKAGSDMEQGHKDVSRAYILKAAEDSLKRLQTDYIDLYQTHWDNEETPVDETLEAYDILVKQGKVKWIGASNLSPERLRGSLEVSKSKGYPTYQTLQPEYNLYDREKFEKLYQPFCVENNISVISYYSLASGFLTGKYRSEADLAKSKRGGGIKKYLDERGLRILKALDEISAKYNTTPASIALAWLMAQPTIAAPIASATSAEQLKALINAVNIVLDNDAISVLNTASSY